MSQAVLWLERVGTPSGQADYQSRCMQVEFGVVAFAAVRTLDDVTIFSEATARAFLRLKQEEESEREETICCTASSTPFATVMMCLTWLQLHQLGSLAFST